ncbi:hypothetical protein IFR05_014846 [Cadophora sp. M221]|nr:hypothetical protein IFR05_014846 [Cadophora sp. M221]
MDAERSAQKSSSPALRSSPAARSMSSTSGPESFQHRAQPRKKKAPSLRRPQSIVTVKINSEDETESFIIHKDIICHHFSFFANAFNGNLLEGKTQTMNLSDFDSDIFGILVEWFYTQKIDIDPKDSDENVLFLAKFWMLAQRFVMPSLQNNIMDGLQPLIECTEGEGLRGFLHYVYESSDSPTILKRLAADRMAWATSAKGLNVCMSGGHLPEALLMDIIMSLKRDHVHILELSMKFGTFGSAKEYFVGVEGGVVVPKEEK